MWWLLGAHKDSRIRLRRQCWLRPKYESTVDKPVASLMSYVDVPTLNGISCIWSISNGGAAQKYLICRHANEGWRRGRVNKLENKSSHSCSFLRSTPLINDVQVIKVWWMMFAFLRVCVSSGRSRVLQEERAQSRVRRGELRDGRRAQPVRGGGPRVPQHHGRDEAHAQPAVSNTFRHTHIHIYMYTHRHSSHTGGIRSSLPWMNLNELCS